MNEHVLQAVIMRRALVELHHQVVLPNDTSFFAWESDLLSINQSGYINEYECKISKGDYARDAKKRKFNYWPDGKPVYSALDGANYFWYVTWDFDIDPPDYAGWIKVSKNRVAYFDVVVKKVAPLRHKNKQDERKLNITSRLLSFKLMSAYHGLYIKPEQIQDWSI